MSQFPLLIRNRATPPHRAMVERAGKWLLNTRRCGVVLLEASGAGWEIPDAIGYRFGGRETTIVECKCSRADFLADREKSCRKSAYGQVGALRYFLAPKGMIQPDELPDGWGLLEAWVSSSDGDDAWEKSRGRIREVVKATERERDVLALSHEMGMLYSAMRKVRVGAFIALGEAEPADRPGEKGEGR